MTSLIPATASEPMEFRFGQRALPVQVWLIDGEPWFAASVVAAELGYRMASDMTRRLDADEKGTRSVRTPGGAQNVTIISESGLYGAILGSRIAGAADFKRWVTRKVLPAIRRTGSYSTAATPALTDDEIMHQALTISARRVEELKAEVAELKPKADIADTYLTAQGGARLVREAAKLLGMREKDLRRFLLHEKLIFVKHAQCGDVQYDHYAQYAHHFKATEHIVRHTWGNCSHYTLTILPRGMELIAKRRGELALA